MAMFSRKLRALGYHHPEEFNVSDTMNYRNCVVWLEDMKIRVYKIEDRKILRDINSKQWGEVFGKYLMDLACPVDKKNPVHVLNWLLSHAIRLEYAEASDTFKKKHQDRQQRKEGKNGSIDQAESDGLGEITSENPDLKAGISSVSKILALPFHHDHIVLLQAIQKIIHERLTETAINVAKKAAGAKKKGKGQEGDFIPVGNVNLGFGTNDSAIDEASKILRLLHLRELRNLQTHVNKAIVSAQTVTANPKTDESLGRVGR